MVLLPSNMRLAQFTFAALLGAYSLVVALTNMSDYGVNFEFVRMVAGMSDTFSALKSGRSIQQPVMLHAMYMGIIAIEAGSGLLCGWGAWQMWRTRHAPAGLFETAKRFAVLGVLLGLVLWLGAFAVVGGEWFLMWQSKTWNAQGTALSLSIIYGIALSILVREG